MSNCGRLGEFRSRPDINRIPVATMQIRSLHPRVIAADGDDDASASSARTSLNFDYASLLKKRRVPRCVDSDARARPNPASQVATAHGDDQNKATLSSGSHGDGGALSAIDAYRALTRADKPTTDDESSTISGAEREALGTQVSHATAPVVSAMFRQQQNMVALLGSLAREIGAFCGDPSIANGGNWDVQLALDPKILPHTTLHLSLSRFRLELRFDAPDVGMRQLLLEHSESLERELGAILRAWGEARDIELTVW
jgi:type III secretion control protein HpaP